MPPREDALLEVDAVLLDATSAVVQKLEQVITDGSAVTVDDISGLFLDEVFFDVGVSLQDVLRELFNSHAFADGSEEQVLAPMFLAVEAATGNAEQELWEAIRNILFDLEHMPAVADVGNLVERIFWSLREGVAAIVDGAVAPSSSSATEDEWGVILPVARRRRMGEPWRECTVRSPGMKKKSKGHVQCPPSGKTPP